MCFGPVASFTASAFLAGMGHAVLRNVRTRKEILFAAFPALFSLQQFIEGTIWLALRHHAPRTVLEALTFCYLVFAYSLWPVLCPVSVYLIEYDPARKKLLRGFIGLGVLTSAYLLYFILHHPFYAAVANCSIRYQTFVPGAPAFTGVYVLATLAPYFLSSHRSILFFGLPNLVFCALAWFVYQTTFISVWCFFAAVISANLYFFLRRLHHQPLLPVPV